MLGDGLILSIGFLGFVIFFTMVFLLTRKFPTYPIHIFFSSFILGFLGSIVFLWLFVPLVSLRVLGLLLYSLFAASYILGMYLNIHSSLHVRILQEVAKAGPKGLTYVQLLERYNKEVILQKRISWLTNSGEIERRGDIFRPCRRRFSSLLIREKIILLLSKLYGTRT